MIFTGFHNYTEHKNHMLSQTHSLIHFPHILHPRKNINLCTIEARKVFQLKFSRNIDAWNWTFLFHIPAHLRSSVCCCRGSVSYSSSVSQKVVISISMCIFYIIELFYFFLLLFRESYFFNEILSSRFYKIQLGNHRWNSYLGLSPSSAGCCRCWHWFSSRRLRRGRDFSWEKKTAITICLVIFLLIINSHQ